jgi:hypothetical protein
MRFVRWACSLAVHITRFYARLAVLSIRLYGLPLIVLCLAFPAIAQTPPAVGRPILFVSGICATTDGWGSWDENNVPNDASSLLYQLSNYAESC